MWSAVEIEQKYEEQIMNRCIDIVALKPIDCLDLFVLSNLS